MFFRFVFLFYVFFFLEFGSALGTQLANGVPLLERNSTMADTRPPYMVATVFP